MPDVPSDPLRLELSPSALLFGFPTIDFLVSSLLDDLFPVDAAASAAAFAAPVADIAIDEAAAAGSLRLIYIVAVSSFDSAAADEAPFSGPAVSSLVTVVPTASAFWTTDVGVDRLLLLSPRLATGAAAIAVVEPLLELGRCLADMCTRNPKTRGMYAESCGNGSGTRLLKVIRNKCGNVVPNAAPSTPAAPAP